MRPSHMGHGAWGMGRRLLDHCPLLDTKSGSGLRTENDDTY